MGKMILILIAAYVAVNAGILWWFWRSLAGWTATRWCVGVALAALMAFFPLLYRNGGASWPEIAALKAGCWWIGSFGYVFALIPLAEALNFFAARYREGGRFDNAKMAAAVLAVAFAVAVAGRINAAFPALREARLRVRAERNASGGLPPPVTLAVLSDLHLGRVNGTDVLARAVDLVAPHRPDAVLYAGDVIDDHLAVDEAELAREVARLAPPLGTWGVPGNHEYIAGPIENSLAMLERGGIRVLRDEAVALDGRLALAGRDDLAVAYFDHGKRKSLADVLDGLGEAERRLPLVVLDHQPRFPEDAERVGAALQLSGHTHNGQLWPYNYIVGRLYENAGGLSTRGKTHYLVSVGTGTWGPPLRNNARPEVWLVRLEFVD